MDHEVIVMWDEPLVKPLHLARTMLFHRVEESHERLFRERSTSFDIDITTNSSATMSVVSTHDECRKMVLLCTTMERLTLVQHHSIINF